MQKLVHKKRMSMDMHTVEFDMYHDLWGGGEIASRNWKCHVLLGMWHWGGILEENVDVSWHSF